VACQLIQRACQSLHLWLSQGHQCLLLIALAMMISGCADYDLGLNFRHAQSSQLVQQVRIDRRFTDLASPGSQQWIQALVQQTHHWGGRVQHQDEEAVIISLPLGGARDLEEKFAQLMAPLQTNPLGVQTELRLQQSNWLLAVRDRLTLQADLRGLGIQDKAGQALVTPGRLLALTVHLTTPWGFQRVEGTAAVQQHRLTWVLQPGVVNNLDVVFWLPNPLGWGALIIGMLMGGGWLIRSRVVAVPSPEHQVLPDTAHEGPS
jgi:hypothetical protein